MAISNETAVSLREPLAELSDLVFNQLSGREVNELIAVVNRANHIGRPNAIDALNEYISQLRRVIEINGNLSEFAQKLSGIRHNYQRAVEDYFGSEGITLPSADVIREEVANHIWNFVIEAWEERTEALSGSGERGSVEDVMADFTTDFAFMNFPIKSSPIYSNDYESPVYFADEFMKRNDHIDDFFASDAYKSASKVFGDVDAYVQVVSDISSLVELLEYAERILKIRRNSCAEVANMAADVVPNISFLWFCGGVESTHEAAKLGRFNEDNERELSYHILGPTRKRARDILSVDALRNEVIVNAIDGWHRAINALFAEGLDKKISQESLTEMMEAMCGVANAELKVADELRGTLHDMTNDAGITPEIDVFRDMLRDFVAEHMNRFVVDFERFVTGNSGIAKIVEDRDDIRAVVDYVKQHIGDEIDDLTMAISDSSKFAFMSDVNNAIAKHGELAKVAAEFEDMVKDVRSFRPKLTEPFLGLNFTESDITRAHAEVERVYHMSAFRTAKESVRGEIVERFDYLCGRIEKIAMSDPGFSEVN